MPRIIVKCRYYSSEKSVRDIGGMLRYIATREGVEKFGDGWKTAPVSKAQEDLIRRFTNTIKQCKRLPEHQSYLQARTKGAASEFISAVLENYPEMLSEKTYLDYIATRPRVERVEGTHGLFTDKDVPINLDDAATKVRDHKGNVYTVIVSLKREDAERLGYNIADQWMKFVRMKIGDIASAHNIPMHALKWYGAYHNESHHPHIHLMLYSTDEKYPGYIDRKGIDSLRHKLGTHIFKDELSNTYDLQTEYRNKINADALDRIEILAEKIRTGIAMNNEFVLQFVALAKRLQSVSGKKVYGYLPKSVKKQVCDLVDLLERDEDIAQMYELWYQAKCDVYHTYTDNDPIKKPLSQEEAFKPIRNAMIREADELGVLLGSWDEEEEKPATTESDTSQKDVVSGETTASAPKPTPNPTPTPITHSSSPASHGEVRVNMTRAGIIATSVARFGKNLSQTFRNNFYAQVDKMPMSVDSRLMREIEAKKKGQNLSM